MRIKLFLSVFLFGLIAAVLAAPAGALGEGPRLSGKVITIMQGDTIKVALKGSKTYVLFYGIACPSKKQSFGERARKFTGDYSFGRIVTIVPKTEARRDGIYAEVMLPDGMNLNQELVKQGLCWWDKRYAPGDKNLEALEKDARRQKLGLWSEPNPIPPWEFSESD